MEEYPFRHDTILDMIQNFWLTWQNNVDTLATEGSSILVSFFLKSCFHWLAHMLPKGQRNKSDIGNSKRKKNIIEGRQ